MATISRLNAFTSTAVLLLVLIGYGGATCSSTTPKPTSDLLQQVIVSHYRAIEDNQLDEAMHYYHSQSPEIVDTRRNIELDLSQFLLKTTTLSFYYVGQQGEFAVAKAKHKYLIIVGLKFIEHFVEVKYLLREEHGNWKIWRQSKISNVSSSY